MELSNKELICLHVCVRSTVCEVHSAEVVERFVLERYFSYSRRASQIRGRRIAQCAYLVIYLYFRVFFNGEFIPVLVRKLVV